MRSGVQGGSQTRRTVNSPAPGMAATALATSPGISPATGQPGAGEVSVRLVWDPPWTPERMSEDARLALGM